MQRKTEPGKRINKYLYLYIDRLSNTIHWRTYLWFCVIVWSNSPPLTYVIRGGLPILNCRIKNQIFLPILISKKWNWFFCARAIQNVLQYAKWTIAVRVCSEFERFVSHIMPYCICIDFYNWWGSNYWKLIISAGKGDSRQIFSSCILCHWRQTIAQLSFLTS